MKNQKLIVLALLSCLAMTAPHAQEIQDNLDLPPADTAAANGPNGLPPPVMLEGKPVEDSAPARITETPSSPLPPPGQPRNEQPENISPPVGPSRLAGEPAGSAPRNEVNVSPQGVVTWRHAADGVTVEWYPDGRFRRIYSRYSQPVEFPDRRGLNTAYVIAEEKAKAGILRFLSQSGSNERLIEEAQSDISEATRKRETDMKAVTAKTNASKFSRSLREVTHSYAAGTLYGVTVLERGYDDGAEEAWVMLGISDRTVQAAKTARQMINSQQLSGSPVAPMMAPSSFSPPPQLRRADGLAPMSSEIKSSVSQDW